VSRIEKSKGNSEIVSPEQSFDSIVKNLELIAGTDEVKKEIVSTIVDILSVETKYPKYQLKPVVKLLFPYVGRWGKGMVEENKWVVLNSLWLQSLLPTIEKYLKKSVKKIKAEIAAREAAQGKRSSLDVEDLDLLSTDRRALLEILRNQEVMAQADQQTASQFLAELKTISQRLERPLPLTIPSKPENARDEYALSYNERRSQFHGREGEMSDLKAFLDSEGMVRWWLIWGGGGSGKSRLALEFTLSLQYSGWRAGWFKSAHGLHEYVIDKGWRPDCPTFIVIDYVAGRAESVARAITHLEQNRDSLKHPVRLLLLEREGLDTAPWARQWATGSDIIHLMSALHKNQDREIGRITDDDLWAIVHSFAPDNKNRKGTLEALSRMDEQKRPLFAMLTGLAMQEGKDPMGWSREEILGWFMDREENLFWKRDKVTEGDKLLLALATICGGIELEGDQPKTLGEMLNESDLDRYRAMTGQPREEGRRRRAPLTPDIVGEYFVLRLFDEMDDGKPSNKKAWEDILTTALDLRSEWDEFFSRLVEDFLKDERADRLFELMENRMDGREMDGHTVSFLFAFAFRLIAAGKLDRAERIMGVLSHLESRMSPGASVIAKHHSMLSSNLVIAFGEAGKPEVGERIYRELVDLAGKYKEEPELRMTQARAAFNLVIAFGEAEKPEEGERIYRELVDLAAKYEKKPEIRLNQVKAAVKMVLAFGDAGKPEEGERIYRELVDLAGKYKEEPELRLNQTNAAVNMVFAFGDAGKTDEGERIYREIEKLAVKYEKEPEIRLRQARAAVNLVTVFCKAGKPEEGERIYRELVALTERYEEEPEIRLTQAEAAFNLVFVFSKAGKPDEGERIYRELVDLLGKYPDDRGLDIAREELSKLIKLLGDQSA